MREQFISLSGHSLDLYRALHLNGPMTTSEIVAKVGAEVLPEVGKLVTNGLVGEVGSKHSPITGLPMVKYGVLPN